MARLAGLPGELIQRAQQILQDLNNGPLQPSFAAKFVKPRLRRRLYRQTADSGVYPGVRLQPYRRYAGKQRKFAHAAKFTQL